jgi:hypothetical protein
MILSEGLSTSPVLQHDVDICWQMTLHCSGARGTPQKNNDHCNALTTLPDIARNNVRVQNLKYYATQYFIIYITSILMACCHTQPHFLLELSCWPLGNTQPSLCPVSVCVHSPVAAFHILVVLLQELASTEEPSAENATKNTRPRCLESIRVHSPVMAFHTLAVLRISHTPLALRNHLEKILPSVQMPTGCQSHPPRVSVCMLQWQHSTAWQYHRLKTSAPRSHVEKMQPSSHLLHALRMSVCTPHMRHSTPSWQYDHVKM